MFHMMHVYIIRWCGIPACRSSFQVVLNEYSFFCTGEIRGPWSDNRQPE